MAAYLCLRDKDGKEHFEGLLLSIDARICKEVFDTEPDTEEWIYNWMDTIGFSLAMGNSYERTREFFSNNKQLLKIIDWLEANFENTSYHGTL